jgi:pimeloyl-ACP methyl ester carboxylesterase
MKLDDIKLPVGTGDTVVDLRLRRLTGAPRGARAVLLLHGGNTLSDIYLAPGGGLAGYLHDNKYDVWLLDWRASPFVLGRLMDEGPLGGSFAAERAAYTLDRVVDEDIVGAVTYIREAIGDGPPISIVAWCLSSGAVSMAIARGALEGKGVTNVVLMTLGLFYAVKWNSWLKAEDFIFERVLHDDPECRGVTPNPPLRWTKDMADAYAKWPRAWLPGGKAQVDDLLPRLTFMVGQPYATERLAASREHEPLNRYFGLLHIGLYLHISQNVRRGFAAVFDAPEVGGGAAPGDLAPRHFRDKRLTLIVGGQDGVWHREALDQMYDWLCSNGCDPSKKVHRDRNIVELLWGKGVKDPGDVYDDVAKGVGLPAR